MPFRYAASLILCAVLAAQAPARAGVVADETMVIDFLQFFEMRTHVITSIQGDKARREFTVRMKDEETHSTEIHRLDRGVVYSLNEASREYGESRLAGAAAMDSSRQIASIAAALNCQWAAVVMKKTEAGAAQVRIDVSHRCKPTVPAGPSCTLGITYDQWSTRPNELHAELARYRREYAAKAGTETGIAEEFLMFSQFGVPVDPVLLESIRKATAKEGQPVRTSAVLRASRSCFTDAGKGSDASTELGPPSMIQYVGAMLLSAWVTEKGSQSSNKSADQPETLGTISTELASIRAQKFPAGEFEVPQGFKRAF